MTMTSWKYFSAILSHAVPPLPVSETSTTQPWVGRQGGQGRLHDVTGQLGRTGQIAEPAVGTGEPGKKDGLVARPWRPWRPSRSPVDG